MLRFSVKWLVTSCALALAMLASSGTAQASLIGFTFAIDSQGVMWLENESDSASLTSLELTLAGTTVFDTTNAAPGSVSSPWTLIGTTGDVVPTFPDDAASDGQQNAIIGFSSFDPDDLVRLFVDLDPEPNLDIFDDGIGTLVTAVFSNGSRLSDTVTIEPRTISGLVFQNTASANVLVPEPAILALFWIGLIGLGVVRRCNCSSHRRRW